MLADGIKKYHSPAEKKKRKARIVKKKTAPKKTAPKKTAPKKYDAKFFKNFV